AVASPSADELARRMEDAVAANFALPRLAAALRRRRAADARAELAGVIDELFRRTFETRDAADVLERSAQDVPELAAAFYGRVRRDIVHRPARRPTPRLAPRPYR